MGAPFQGHHKRREAELVGALILAGVAVALLMPGPTFSRPTFAAIAPGGTWGAELLGVAVVRMIGLWVNESKRHSPSFRFVTSAAGATVWGWVTALFWHDGYPGVNTGCGDYGVLAAVTPIAPSAPFGTRVATTPGPPSSGGPRRDRLALLRRRPLPAEYLKAAGTLLGGASLALGTYVVARIRDRAVPPRRSRGRRGSPSIPPTETSATRSSAPEPT